jgi:GMP synthase (glutamine-hydrolysing)
MMKKKEDLKLLFIQVRKNDKMIKSEMDCILDRLNLKESQIRVINVIKEHIDPRLLKDVDAVIVGGSGEFYVSDYIPELENLRELIRVIAEIDKPFFGICFGMQILAQALGGDVESNPNMAELGNCVIETNGEALKDPIFSNLPNTFLAHAGHKDSVTILPPHSVIFGGSKKCPIQAIRVKKNVYGTQFHPELTVPEMRRRFNAYWDHYENSNALQELGNSLEETHEAHKLLQLFIDKVVLKL